MMSLTSILLGALLLVLSIKSGIATIVHAHEHDCGTQEPSPEDRVKAERAEIEMFGKSAEWVCTKLLGYYSCWSTTLMLSVCVDAIITHTCGIFVSAIFAVHSSRDNTRFRHNSQSQQQSTILVLIITRIRAIITHTHTHNSERDRCDVVFGISRDLRRAILSCSIRQDGCWYWRSNPFYYTSILWFLLKYQLTKEAEDRESRA